MSQKNEDVGFSVPAPVRMSSRRAIVVTVAVFLALAAAFVVGWLPKRGARAALEAEAASAQAGSTLRVQVVRPKLLGSDRTLSLPGSILPLEETQIYARASGYVRKWSFSIGDRVKQGDVLAELDTPEVDQQLLAARAGLSQADAALIQAQANDQFSKLNLRRNEQLTKEGIASTQELEKQRAQTTVDEAAVAVAKAKVAAERAEVDRLSQLKSFGTVTAPFAGTIVARSTERGALVTAGNAAPLFKLANSATVRVIVQVPQDVAPSVRSGLPARLTVREYAGREFEGTIAHASGALDPATRTMETEVRVDNPKGELLAGMYGQVALTLATPHRVVELPATALFTDGNGVRVAVIDAASKVRLVPVVVQRDTGATVEIASGLEGTERVARLAGAGLIDGRQVVVAD